MSRQRGSGVTSLLDILKKIPLNDFHFKNGAKFSPFAGYSMPLNYLNGIISEHIHVREKAGIFDVSHMGQIIINKNINNINKLEKYIPLQLNKLKNNRSYYSFLLNSKGGIIDDIIVSSITLKNKNYFFIVYNASRKEIDENIFNQNLNNFNIIDDHCLLAIQGPLAFNILSKIINIDSEMKFFDIKVIKYKDKNIILSRSGYTGEDGFEISLPFELSESFIEDLLMINDCQLSGLGSRDSLRLEAGLSLYGNELNETTTPIEAGLSWAIDLNTIKSNKLNGSKNLKRQIDEAPKKKKIGMIALNKIILRKDLNLIDKDNKKIGLITSGCYSPILSKSIALGYIDKDYDLDKNFYCEIRNNFEPIKYVNLPFIKKKYIKE